MENIQTKIAERCKELLGQGKATPTLPIICGYCNEKEEMCMCEDMLAYDTLEEVADRL